ncbi:hypothetical protein P280DRAFT_27064 [Massarina eburnea CBS 473.64]|uniref:Uncharacterized protein n=1 Tax=Massarina eburnea CBS 473.64 TaxID=1395130 RepID=A0A6A6RYL6_9PLEO|nr:hypothetical protein P280DRAFT_27064 [Massarina eburnea CBS 473.64]
MRPLLRRALQEFPSLLPYFRSGSTKTKTHRSKESSEGVKVHREMKIAYECDDTRKDFDKEGFLKLDDGDEKTISENKKEEKTISENKKDERGDLEKDISI